ncbi:unnamed protein product [Camellia sinensis]
MSSVCPICLKDDESIKHVLFDYPWAQAMWFGSMLNLRIDKGMVTNVVQWIVDWITVEREVRTASKLLSHVFLIGWYIWEARNDFIFNHLPINLIETLSKIAWGLV